MKRMLVFCSGLLLSLVLTGCGSDPRDGLVAATVNDINTAASKIDNIKNKINEAVKNAEGGKTPDFKEAAKEVDALKGIAKEMQRRKLEAEAIKDKGTDEERKEIAENYRKRVNDAIELVSMKKKELNETLAAVEADHKSALKEVRDKLAEADGEFEAISRK